MKKQMTSLPPMVLLQKIDHQLQRINWNPLAKATGFQRRKPIKITPWNLIRGACLLVFYSRGSLETFASLLGILSHQTISKQAVAKRISFKGAEFLRQALYRILMEISRLSASKATGVFRSFRRVLIQDSTHLALSPKLAHVFPGNKNKTDKNLAILKIQTIYDILSERFIHFDFSGFTRNDSQASPDILALLGKGDLLLRDLGYFVSSVFKKIHELEAFYLSRFRSDVSLWTENGSQPFDLLRHLRRFQMIDMNLYLGEKEKVPVRLVAVRLPQPVAAERRRKAYFHQSRRYAPSKKRLALLDWEIFITNVPTQQWNTQTLCQIYGLRWRIETIFKSWKSHFHMTCLSSPSASQIQFLVYGRLIFICLFHVSFFPLLHSKSSSPPISLLKLSHFLSQHFFLLLPLSLTPNGSHFIQSLFSYYCPYEKRKKRSNFSETLMSLG